MAQGDIVVIACKYRPGGTGVFSVVASGQGNNHKLKYMKFCLTIRNQFLL